MHRLRGVVQHYAWGDPEAIPRLMGAEPDGTPWAEVWFGTHPGGPSRLDDGGALADAVGELPYLVKLIAAAEPLSLQTHPDARQAAAGFAREDAVGLALDDDRRIYRDRSAKPELICALTPFEALCGLRDPAELHAEFLAAGWDELAAMIAPGDLRGYLRSTLLRDDLRLPPDLPSWAADLAARYPGQSGAVAASLALNHLVLEPGEALLLDAGNLHLYIRGLGIEVMGASDNVVRAGFTAKHVDVEEVLRIVAPHPLAQPVVRPTEIEPGVAVYPTVSDAFELVRCTVQGTVRLASEGAQVVLCTHGSVSGLRSGEAGIAIAGDEVELSGSGTVWLCRVPRPAFPADGTSPGADER